MEVDEPLYVIADSWKKSSLYPAKRKRSYWSPYTHRPCWHLQRIWMGIWKHQYNQHHHLQNWQLQEEKTANILMYSSTATQYHPSTKNPDESHAHDALQDHYRRKWLDNHMTDTNDVYIFLYIDILIYLSLVIWPLSSLYEDLREKRHIIRLFIVSCLHRAIAPSRSSSPVVLLSNFTKTSVLMMI